MNENIFTITEYSAPLFVFDSGGKRKEFENRYASCFIVTVKGKIRFSGAGFDMISDKEHPVFLPQGLDYTNECIEEAESYVFNFHTLESITNPLALTRVSECYVKERYEGIKQSALLPRRLGMCLALRELYSLAFELFAEKKEMSSTTALLSRAIEYMMAHYSEPNLTVSDISASCFISEIYLRKIFERELGTTPHKKLTEIRMEKAALLLKEKLPVTYVAVSVGYSDVFGFSRAFKRFYGYPPSMSPPSNQIFRA